MGIEGIMVRSFAQFGVVQTDYDMTRLLTENALLRQPGGIQEAAPISPDILTPEGRESYAQIALLVRQAARRLREEQERTHRQEATEQARAEREEERRQEERQEQWRERWADARMPHRSASWRHERWTDAGYGGRLAPAGRTCARRPSIPVRQPDGANHRRDSGTGGTDADCATNRGTRRRAGHRTGKRPDGGANGRRRCRAHGFAHPAPPDCLTRPAVPSAAGPLRERMPPFAAAGKGHRLSCVPRS